MKALLHLTIVIVLLYILFRLSGSYLLPLWNERRHKRYQRRLLDRNPQIDKERLQQRLKEQEEKKTIIEKRKLFR